MFFAYKKATTKTVVANFILPLTLPKLSEVFLFDIIGNYLASFFFVMNLITKRVAIIRTIAIGRTMNALRMNPARM